jgi:hypothetical protein
VDSFVDTNNVKIDGHTVETDALRVVFDEAWQMTSIYDKKNDREVLKKGAVGNELRVYADYPDTYDAWEWQSYSRESYRTITDVASVEVVDDGARRGIRIVRQYMKSTVTQTVWFADGTARIDFETVVDWQERQVDGVWHYDEGIAECFEHTKLGYASGDGVVLRVEGAEDSYEWQYHTSSYGSKMGTESILNPLFSPVVSLTEATTSAPSAEILTVGNRDIIAESSYIAPRIVVYHGLSELPEGEHWQAIETPTKYPFASFHSPSADVTLSFGDRDGLVGLHRYYDRELDERAERGRLRCTIALRPDEYIDLLDPSSKGATIRSRFRLRTEYGSSLFILESIDNYDSDSLCATCTFRRTLND